MLLKPISIENFWKILESLLNGKRLLSLSHLEALFTQIFETWNPLGTKLKPTLFEQFGVK
jgi:hypothetical protein